MKKTIAVILLSTLCVFNVYGRCNGGYADGVLNEVLTCGDQKDLKLEEVARDGKKVWREVSGICADGCYNALWNPDLKPGCDKRYAEAVGKFSKDIKSYARKNRCVFNEAKLNGLITGKKNSKEEGPLASCFWSHKTVINPKGKCGKKAACVGAMYCLRGPYNYRATDSVTLQCDAVNGKCPSINVCANAENPKWVDIGTSTAGSKVLVKEQDSGTIMNR